MSALGSALIVRDLGVVEYQKAWDAMKVFTDSRDLDTPDELWLVEHPGVFTQGQAGKDAHILRDIGIPIIHSDRGGQVTYHGPGQLVVYVLVNLRRKKLGVRDLVSGIEDSIIRLLHTYQIEATAKREAPGVYVASKKVAALGLRVRKGCSFHGLSLNVNMDLEPFDAINPCGYEGLGVTQLSALGVSMQISQVATALVNELVCTFGYDDIEWDKAPGGST